MINVLLIGDVVSDVGCEYLRQVLPSLKREMKINIVIANGENSANCNGITKNSAKHLLDSGVDVITTGNHVFKRYEILSFFEECENLIRPANYPDCVEGKGYYIYDGGYFKICIINMLGTSFMEPLKSPFDTIDEILKKIDCKNVIVDFHAEATGEKRAYGFYLNGKVSAVIGTHTHVQTADEQILSEGTGYMTDVGMTGPIDTVLGVNPKNVIDRLKYHTPTRFEVPDLKCMLNAVLLEIDEKTGKCINITRLRKE
ncbi:MAG: TIGR00282 family metallophosphoesterase [Oscillospiraceae bacterium]